jgi:hypothetical protein
MLGLSIRMNNDTSVIHSGFCPQLRSTFASTKALQTPSVVVAVGRVSPVALEVHPANRDRYSVDAIEITRASRNSDVRKNS